MKRLGKVSHYAKQGFLILRSNWAPLLNDVVVDKNLKVIGIVKDVFGPVKMPYIAVKPEVRNPEELVGQTLYVDKRRKEKVRKKNRRERKGKRRGRPAPKKRG